MKDGTKIKAVSKKITEILQELEADIGCGVTGVDVTRWNGEVHGVILDVRFCRGKEEKWEDYGKELV